MKKIITLFLFLIGGLTSYSQYNKEKLSSLLTGDNEKSWTVSGINVERPEKNMMFTKNNSVKIQFDRGEEKSMNWSLKSTDDIRWFILIGEQNYELVVSYDKKGNEYIKLTHQSSKGVGDYQMKLKSIK